MMDAYARADLRLTATIDGHPYYPTRVEVEGVSIQRGQDGRWVHRDAASSGRTLTVQDADELMTELLRLAFTARQPGSAGYLVLTDSGVVLGIPERSWPIFTIDRDSAATAKEL